MSLSVVSAHQPRIVLDKIASSENPIVVSNPEISQAFYGNLMGDPQYYSISSSKDFELYLNVLVPILNSAAVDLSFDVYKDNELIASINGAEFSWNKFHEEFAGDDYWKGPEFEQSANAGNYIIKVSSSENTGKYVLAVGKIESFPPGEALNSVFLLPSLKKDFFEKSPFTAYFNRIGGYVLIFLVSVAALACIAIVLSKKLNKKKRLK